VKIVKFVKTLFLNDFVDSSGVFANCFVTAPSDLIFAEVRNGTWRTRAEVWETRASRSNAESLHLNRFTGHVCELL